MTRADHLRVVLPFPLLRLPASFAAGLRPVRAAVARLRCDEVSARLPRDVTRVLRRVVARLLRPVVARLPCRVVACFPRVAARFRRFPGLRPAVLLSAMRPRLARAGRLPGGG
jgi:hypothetical protein